MNLLPFFKGEVKEAPQPEFLYWSDDGELMALRYRDWKIAFLEQNTEISPEVSPRRMDGTIHPVTQQMPQAYTLAL